MQHCCTTFIIECRPLWCRRNVKLLPETLHLKLVPTGNLLVRLDFLFTAKRCYSPHTAQPTQIPLRTKSIFSKLKKKKRTKNNSNRSKKKCSYHFPMFIYWFIKRLKIWLKLWMMHWAASTQLQRSGKNSSDDSDWIWNDWSWWRH